MSTTKTFRFDPRLIEKISEVAKKHGQSPNQFISNTLKWRVSIDPLIPTFDGIMFGRETFKSIIGIVDTDSLEIAGWELGKKHFVISRTLFESRGEELSFVRYISEVLDEHARWFRIEGGVSETSKKMTIHHNFGVKWSMFLKSYLSSAYEVVSGAKLFITTNDTFVKIKFAD